MNFKSKASRQEKQVRNFGRGFGLAGLILLAISMTMAGTFGWGLGHELSAKIGTATLFVTIDFLGALLMSVIGLFFAWRWWTIGCLSVVALILCSGCSMLAVFGFQASNRGAVTKQYESTERRADDRLKWLRGLGSQKDLRDRDKLLSEEREQYRETQKETQPDPDAQASELAKMFGVEKGQAQRVLSMGISAFVLLMQFVCLSMRSFLRHRVEPVIAAHAMSGASVTVAQSTPKFGKFGAVPAAKVGRDAARSEVIKMLVTGERWPKNKDLAERWGVSETTVCHWLQKFGEEGHDIPFRGRGKLRLINGGGTA